MTQFNAATRQHIKEAAKSLKIVELQRADIIRNLMSTPAGRQWIHDLLLSCHLFATSFDTNGLRMSFAEGERNIGLRIFSDIMSHAPTLYTQMMDEENARNTTAERRRKPVDADDASGIEAGSTSDD